jgi:hypothetical protein
MRPYNPDDTVTLEFAVAARALGPREASRLFDCVRLEQSLRRMRLLTDVIGQEERSANVDALLGHVREFMEVSNLGDVLIKTAYLLEDECLACALSAGGVCPDHAV